MTLDMNHSCVTTVTANVRVSTPSDGDSVSLQPSVPDSNKSFPPLHSTNLSKQDIPKRAHQYFRYKLGANWHYHHQQSTSNSNTNKRSSSVPAGNSPFWNLDPIRDPRNCVSNYCIKIKDIPSSFITPNEPLEKSLMAQNIRIEQKSINLSAYNTRINLGRIHFLKLKRAQKQCLDDLDECTQISPNELSELDLCDDEIRLIRINLNETVTNLICPRCGIYLQSIPITEHEIAIICYNFPFCRYPLDQRNYRRRFRWKKVKYVGPSEVMECERMVMTEDAFNKRVAVNALKMDKLTQRMRVKQHSFTFIQSKESKNALISNLKGNNSKKRQFQICRKRNRDQITLIESPKRKKKRRRFNPLKNLKNPLEDTPDSTPSVESMDSDNPCDSDTEYHCVCGGVLVKTTSRKLGWNEFAECTQCEATVYDDNEAIYCCSEKENHSKSGCPYVLCKICKDTNESSDGGNETVNNKECHQIKDEDDDNPSMEPVDDLTVNNGSISDVICICGSKLVVISGGKCYDGLYVECNKCGTEIGGKQMLYHCPRGILAMDDHSEGFDLCRRCAIRSGGKHRVVDREKLKKVKIEKMAMECNKVDDEKKETENAVIDHEEMNQIKEPKAVKKEKKEIIVVKDEDEDVVFLGSSRPQNVESVVDEECAIPFDDGALDSLLKFDGIDIENMSFDDGKMMTNNQDQIRIKSLFNEPDDVTEDNLSSVGNDLEDYSDFDCMVPLFHVD